MSNKLNPQELRDIQEQTEIYSWEEMWGCGTIDLGPDGLPYWVEYMSPEDKQRYLNQIKLDNRPLKQDRKHDTIANNPSRSSNCSEE